MQISVGSMRLTDLWRQRSFARLSGTTELSSTRVSTQPDAADVRAKDNMSSGDTPFEIQVSCGPLVMHNASH